MKLSIGASHGDVLPGRPFTAESIAAFVADDDEPAPTATAEQSGVRLVRRPVALPAAVGFYYED